LSDHTTLNKEVSLIENGKIRTFVAQCLEKAPDYFWTCPSSSTGKYHPADENTMGGTILHTKRVTRIAADLCFSMGVTSVEKDCVIAAAIMHDMCKLGYPEEGRWTAPGHGALWINVANKVIKSNVIIDSPTIQTIGRLIACHMGRFDIPYVMADNKLDTILQVSDYVASRAYVKVEVL